jgi:predicted transcriptional regulator
MKKASTFRLHEDLQAGLDLISQLQHRPKNKLVNEAVAEYVTRHALRAEDELQAVLRSLKSYQKADPDFTSAIAAFADAEATHGKDADPMEGRPVSSVGPVTQKLRQLLHV